MAAELQSSTSLETSRPASRGSTPIRRTVRSSVSSSSDLYEALPWRGFLKKFHGIWKPGDHGSIIAPQGAGKSTFAGEILRLRRYVLALDPKGGDDTLAALNYERLPVWPGAKAMMKKVQQNDEKGLTSRYVIGPVVKNVEDLAKLRKACADALNDAFQMGNWTVYTDELQVLSDRRMMNLSGPAARLLVAARSKGVSFVSSFQAPSWVPSEALRQPNWIATSYTRDTDTVNRMAEVMGRPKAELRGAIKALPPYWWLIVERNPRAPVMATKPPKLG